jgi:protein arginine kinase
MFQISNQITMGQPEERIVEDLEEIAKEIVGHEENARLRLREEREAVLQDVVARAAAILSSAYLISAEEALERLADLRLGVAMGLMAHPTLSVIDRLMVGIQPAHLLEQSGKELSAKERDELRASWLRDVMQQKAVEQKRRKTR